VAGASAGLELDRAAVAAGELWRVMSGHCTHWTLAQLFWDGVVFAALGCLCWSEDRGLFWRTLVASALAVSVAVLWLQPEIGSYRGLSGIDAALFAALTTTATRSLWRRQRFRAALGVGFAAASLAAKIAWEIVTRTAFFAGDLGEGVVPLPLAHAVGAAAGCAAALLGFAASGGGGGRVRRSQERTPPPRGGCSLP
jgi:rhomboid family GlyGly-CTERM serine protease